jgi:hypothetical protein
MTTNAAARTIERPESVPAATAKQLSCDWRWAAMSAVVFFAVSVWNVSSHVMWRDEIRFWQWACLSPTFAEMRSNMRFEGAPWLSYAWIWLVARTTTNVFAMQLVHVAIASCSVFLFTWRAPFSRTVKLLFPLGYFTLFEYTVITRNYGLILFFVLAAAAIIALPRRRPILLGGVLLLLTQITIWGTGLAGVLYLSAVLKWTILRPRDERLPWPKAMLLGSVVLAGGAICYLSSLPGPGATFVRTWDGDESFAYRFAKTTAGIWRGWIPIPQFDRCFWNTNYYDEQPAIQRNGAVLLFTLAMLIFARRPAALVPLVVGSAGLLWFTYFHFIGAVRHEGLYFVLLIAAYWIDATTAPLSISRPRLARCAATVEALGGPLLLALLVIQAVAGVGVAIADHQRPFSAGKEAADFVRRKLPADAVLVGYDDYSSATMGFYADRRIHSVQEKTPGVLFTQDDRRRKFGHAKLLVEGIDRLLRKESRDVVVFLSPHRDVELSEFREKCPLSNVTWEFLARFDDSTVKDEGPTVYRASRTKPDPSRFEPTME